VIERFKRSHGFTDKTIETEINRWKGYLADNINREMAYSGDRLKYLNDTHDRIVKDILEQNNKD
jgi:hypothetical protein